MRPTSPSTILSLSITATILVMPRQSHVQAQSTPGNATVQVAGTVAANLTQQDRRSRPWSIGTLNVMHSDLLDEDRNLLVYLPGGYDPAKRQDFSLFVFMDGFPNFKATAGMINSLGMGGTIPRMVVVGLSNPNRDRDLIPTKIMNGGVAGGGAKFLASLENEILPYIDANWPTNGFRVFSGHSLGGLTSLNILLEKPDLFDAHIALSPSMEVGEGLMLDACRQFLGGRDELDKFLYLAVGDEVAERGYLEQLAEFLSEQAPRGFLWKSDIFDETDDHTSIRVTGMLAGIRWVFRDWRLTSYRILRMTDQEIESHYREASRRYKQSLSLRVWEVLAAASRASYEPELIDRALELARMAVERWPDQPYSHGTLGECLESAGKLEEAQKVLKVAVQICEEIDDPGHGAVYQRALDRVNESLNK